MLSPDVPDLVALDILASVAELGSLGKAAARHRISQPAVSMRMTALERRLQLDLLQRDPSGTHLTPTGRRVVEQGRRVLTEVASLMSEIDALRAEGTGRLRVAASLTLAEHLLPAWISTVHREMPGVSLSLEVTNSARVVSTVLDGRVDIGFVEGQKLELPEVESVVISADHLVVVVDNGHPWARRRRPLTGEELARTDLIVREPGSGTREVLEEALRPWGGVRTRLELGSPSAVVAAALSGEGPGVVSILTVVGELAAGQLVALDVDGIDLTRSFRAVWSAHRSLPDLARRLLSAAGAGTRSAAGAPTGGGTTAPS